MSPDTVERRLPDDLAMWFFILAGLSVFSLLLLAFAGAQAWQPELFRIGREQLDSHWSLLLTVALLSSGWLAALAVYTVRHGQPRQASGWLLATLLLAPVYVGLKLHEYGRLVDLGLDIEHDTFFTLYWCLTGFRFLHALPDLLVLGWLAQACWRRCYTSQACSGLESGMLYWHVVDLVWVLLFLLIYVLQ